MHGEERLTVMVGSTHPMVPSFPQVARELA